MSRVRSKRQGRKYAAIPNDAMRDENLSLEARGMLALMMGYSDDWMFYRSHLMSIAGIGRDKFQRVMGELQAAGYVVLETMRNDSGHMTGTTYVIHDDPNGSTEGLKTRLSAEGLKNRPPVKPTAGKPGPIRKPDSEAIPTKEENQTCGDFFSENVEAAKTQITETLFEEFWKIYPERFGSNPKSAARKSFRAAIKKFPANELLKAVAAFARSRVGEDPKFTPMASTWLNQERWDGFTDVGASRSSLGKMNPENPMEGIPESVAQVIRYEIDPDQRDQDARDWWARQEAVDGGQG